MNISVVGSKIVLGINYQFLGIFLDIFRTNKI